MQNCYQQGHSSEQFLVAHRSSKRAPGTGCGQFLNLWKPEARGTWEPMNRHGSLQAHLGRVSHRGARCSTRDSGIALSAGPAFAVLSGQD